MKKFLSLLLALVMLFSLVACGDNSDNDGKTPVNSGDNQGDVDVPDDNGLGYTITEFDPEATYTSHGAITTLYANWNPHTYVDGNAIALWDYLSDSLYTLSFNDELHPHEGKDKDPWTSYAIIPQMAAGMATDVTAEVKAEHPDWMPEDATKGYAWEVPLREDLYFETGYHITAETYVQSAKYLLDPRLQNYRSTDFYDGQYGIAGGEKYFKSGTYALSAFVSANMGDDEYVDPANFTVTDAGTYQYEGKDIVLDINSGGNWGLDGGIKTYEGQADQVDRLIAAANDKGQVFLNADLLKDLQDFIAMLHGYGSVDEYAVDAGNYATVEFEEMAFFGQTWPEVDYDSTVGFYAKDEYTLVMVFNTSLDGFYLYWAGFGRADILVEPDVYESCLKQDETGAWTNSYMTSKETSPSFGPYSMTNYQTDKQVAYAKNESWYGWHDDVYHVYKDPNDGNVYRTNMTTNIVLDVVPESATQLQMFLSGQLSSYGLDAIEDYEKYNNSDYLQVAPDAGTGGLWVTGNMNGLKAREAADGFDKTKEDTETIGLTSFHKALAVSFDRQAFIDEVHPDYSTNFGVIGPMYIYDVEDFSVYRQTDQAKQALCDFYSVDTSKFDNLDDAVDSITGYDPEAAKELYKAAYEESLSLGYITDADNDGKCDQTITMIFSSSSPSDFVTRRINYLNSSIATATTGTPFEGKISIVESSPLSNEYLNAFANGSADCFIVAVSGSLFDPFNVLGMYLDPNGAILTNKYYDSTTDMVTINIDGEDITMSATDWYNALNGTPVTLGGKTYNYGNNNAEVETRLTILAALEGKVLQNYYMLPMMCFGSKTLISQQEFSVLDEYANPIIKYGPTRYQYTDAEWEEYVAEQIAEHGQLQY